MTKETKYEVRIVERRKRYLKTDGLYSAKTDAESMALFVNQTLRIIQKKMPRAEATVIETEVEY